MNIIDISIPLNSKLPTWPDGYGLKISKLLEINENSEVNVSRLDLDVHCGTHIDSPLHFVKDGKTTNEINLDRLIGEVLVVEFGEEISIITPEILEAKLINKNVKRILLKTSNSHKKLWDLDKFDKDFCAISSEAANWLYLNNIDLIGIDYCSIQKFYDSNDTHKILLKNNIIILEGLDLRNVQEGLYNLICLPLSVEGIEGVPVRAILTR
jgi:arylformamidase